MLDHTGMKNAWKRIVGQILSFKSTNEITSDVIIHCKDGTIATHQLILASISPDMCQVLTTITIEEKLTILMPEFDVHQVEEYFWAKNKAQNFEKDSNLTLTLNEGLKIEDKLGDDIQTLEYNENCDYEGGTNSIQDSRESSEDESDADFVPDGDDYEDDIYESSTEIKNEELEEEVKDPVVIQFNGSNPNISNDEKKKLFRENMIWYHYTKKNYNTVTVRPITCNHCGKRFKINLKQSSYNFERIVKGHIFAKHHDKITEEQKQGLIKFYNIDVDELKRDKLILKYLKKQKRSKSLVDPETGKIIKKTRDIVYETSRTAIFWNYIEFDPKDTKSSSCKLCGMAFPFNNSRKTVQYMRHLVRIHNIVEKEESLRKYMCSICGKCFGDTSTRKKCEEKHGRETYICPIETCRKEFPSLITFEKHQNSFVHKTHTCQFCGKIFKKLSRLTVHVRSHTGENPFKCEVCDKKFRKIDSLRKHQDNHHAHLNLRKKKYECSHCGYQFKTAHWLEGHMKRKHTTTNTE